MSHGSERLDGGVACRFAEDHTASVHTSEDGFRVGTKNEHVGNNREASWREHHLQSAPHVTHLTHFKTLLVRTVKLPRFNPAKPLLARC